jgi:hypothetical protein
LVSSIPNLKVKRGIGYTLADFGKKIKELKNIVGFAPGFKEKQFFYVFFLFSDQT